MWFVNKFKKLGAVAITALATVASTGTSYASIPSAASMVGQNPLPQSMVSGFGMSGNSKNINIGSYQSGRDVEITTGQELAQNTSSHKSARLGLDSLVKKYDISHQLGVDAMIREIDEEAAKQLFQSKVDTAFAVTDGRRSPYGRVGCAETVTYAGSYYSPALKEEFDKGIAYVPTLLDNLSAKGYSVEPFNGFAEKGDLLVYGDDDHIVISDGLGGCFGNSSSRLRAMYYPDAGSAWGYGGLPTKIVRMSEIDAKSE